MLHCDLRVRWKVASDLRFRAAISEPKTSSFCRISGDLAPPTQKSLAIAIVRFWCAKLAVENAEGLQLPWPATEHQKPRPPKIEQIRRQTGWREICNASNFRNGPNYGFGEYGFKHRTQ